MAKKKALRKRTTLRPRSRSWSSIRRSKLDREWAKAVKLRDGYVCQRCLVRYPQNGAAARGIDAAHIFGRRHGATRHEIENGIALCVGCHRFFHDNPLEFHEFAKVRLGEGPYEVLRREAHGVQDRL